MDKFTDVDIFKTLRAIMETNTAYYRTDFDIDVDFMQKMARHGNPAERTLLWLSRPAGTECETERQTFQRDTSGHNTWRYYSERSNERILAYAVALKQSGMTTPALYGDIYELDYHAHVARVRETSVAKSADITLLYTNGETERMSYKSFNDNIPKYNERFLYARTEPLEPDALARVLAVERASRETGYVEADVDGHIRRMRDGRVTYEAERIVQELSRQYYPDANGGKQYKTVLSHHFVINATNDEFAKLLNELPYESVHFAIRKDSHGDMYAFVDASEIERDKPSVLGQLEAAKTQVAARTTPTEPKKSKGIEV